MKEQDVIEEMIEFLFLKKRRDRMRYILSKENRERAYFSQSHTAEYIDKSLIKYQVNKAGMQEIYTILRKEGGNKKCFLLTYSESGIYNTKDALECAMWSGLGAIMYLGNGVGYFQGEQYIGSPERYILVNNKKRGNPELFE